ncbi:MAG TPA: adenine phosphoribosyltransferase [Longimicrobiaceae bacterium]|nr:adenine phosphoribosyltransferase [Longimicrobiaceae bacterium]
MNDLERLICDVPDFPAAGILFRDITPLLLDPEALRGVVERLAEPFRGAGIQKVAAIESRGFIFGAPLALELGCGFVPVRKLGKLPRPTASREYALEYGKNHLEMHIDAIQPRERVLVVDDVLATGGTARATVEIVEELGGDVAAVAFLIEIGGLNGRATLADREVLSLIRY